MRERERATTAYVVPTTKLEPIPKRQLENGQLDENEESEETRK